MTGGRCYCSFGVMRCCAVKHEFGLGIRNCGRLESDVVTNSLDSHGIFNHPLERPRALPEFPKAHYMIQLCIVLKGSSTPGDAKSGFSLGTWYGFAF